MKVLIQYFPMSLLDFFKGKKYDNMLDFILDVLYACGIDVEDELNKLVCKIFNVGNIDLKAAYNSLATNDKLDIESEFLDGLEDSVKLVISESILAILSCSLIPEIKNKYMDAISYQCKKIENYYTSDTYKKTGTTINYKKTNPTSIGYISIPVNVLDQTGKLNIAPTSPTGMCIYDFSGEKFSFEATRMYSYYKGYDSVKGETIYSLKKETVERKIENSIAEAVKSGQTTVTSSTITEYKAGEIGTFNTYSEALKFAGYIDNDSDESLYEEAKKTHKNYTKKNTFKKYIKTNSPIKANELYKSNDLDAFIWYCLHRGSIDTTYETNKMIWDSRRTSGKRNEGEWEKWLESKDDYTKPIYDQKDALNFVANGTVNIPLHEYQFKGAFPIMQLSRDPYAASEDRLAVAISAERYYRGSANDANPRNILRTNHTMYKFNWDYMTNMKIFSAKNILAGYLNETINGSLLHGMELNYGFNVTTLEQQLSSVIKKALVTDDLSVSDCFFSFSNEDYNNMLYDTELRKFGARNVNNSIVKATSVDTEDVINSLLEVDTAPTLHEKKSVITRTINEVTATPVGIVEQNADLFITLSGWQQIVYNIIYALIKPIVMQLFAPKVMLLFILNFYVAGFVDLNNPKSIDDILDLINRKIFAILKSVITLIKDRIIEMLLDLFYEYITPILESYIALILMEYVEKWLKLLDEAMQCIPMFDFTKWKYSAQIDNVNYADITQNEQNTPETTGNC